MTEAGAQPSLKDRAMGWLKKPGAEKLADAQQAGKDAAGYVGRGLEDVSVATGITPVVREAAGALTPAVNAVGEAAVDVYTAVDRGIDRIDQTVQGAGIHLGRAKEVYDKYNDPSALAARIKERGKALADHVLGGVVQKVEQGLSWAETGYYDHAVGFLKLVGAGDVWGDVVTDVKKFAEQQKRKQAEKKAAKTGEAPKEADARLESVTTLIEASELIKLVSEGRDAAIKFDSMPNATGITIAERLLQGSVPGVTEQANQVQEMKKKVTESRGERPNISWDHEQRLVDRSESRQKEAAILGLEILDMLPETADEITRTGFLEARVKAIDLARKNKGIINSLTSISESISLRFPDRAEAVKAELAKLTTPLYENNEVAKSIYDQVDTEGMVRQASGELYVTLIKGNEIFGRLTKAQQDEVTKGLGATRREGINGRNKYDRYDADAGSTYDVALSAYAELTKVGAAYEAMREHVLQHPELAGQLVVMAERVAQAKYALRLARNEFQAQITIKSKELFDAANATSLEAANTADEQAEKAGRKEYYGRILDRQAARIKEEKPTVKKIQKFLVVAGGVTLAIAIGADVAPGILAALPKAAAAAEAVQLPTVAELSAQAVKALAEAYNFLQANLPTTSKVAVGVGSVLGLSRLAMAIGERLGVKGKKEETPKVAAEPEAETAPVESLEEKVGAILAGLKEEEKAAILKILSKS